MSDTTGIPAAWYTDPGDARQLRYWDGRGWTAQVAPNPALAPAPAPAPAASPAAPPAPPPMEVAPAYTPEPYVASEYTPEPYIAPAYMPLSHVVDPIASPAPNYDEGKANTVPGWLFVFVPLLVLLQLYLPVSARPEDMLTDVGALGARAGLALVALVLALVFAGFDRRQLRDRGFESAPVTALAVLPPVYAIARLFGVGVRGFALTLVALLVQAGVGYAFYAQLPALLAVPRPTATDEPSSEGMVPPYTADQIAYLLTSEGMAAKILYDAHNTALHYDTVECVPLTSTDLGAQTTCEAKSTLADYLIRVQVLESSDGTPFTVTTVTPSIHA